MAFKIFENSKRNNSDSGINTYYTGTSQGGKIGKRYFLNYLFALFVVAATFGLRILLVPWTGAAAPFSFFFAAVVAISFIWGAGPGFFAGALAAPIASYFFINQAHYTPSQSITQSIVFLCEVVVVCYLAANFSKTKRRIETAHQLLEQTTRELKRSECELREAQRVAHVGSWAWDIKTDTLKWSEELYHIFGLDPTSPPPNDFNDQNRFTPEGFVKVHDVVDKALKHGIPYEIEVERIRLDGSRLWISARGEPVLDSDGNMIGLRGTAQDITPLKLLEKAREEWTSVIAHDLRQPIGLIRMCVDFLPRLHVGEVSELEKVTLGRMRTAALSLTRMVDDLLDVSRMEANRLNLEQKWIDPRTVVHEALDRLCYVTNGFRVKVTESGELSPVFADPLRIEQVLGNLISNATKYGDKGSDIHIHLSRCEEGIEISVTNQGKGIPAETIPHLFSRFSRPNKSRELGIPGLGLGLYISKGLVEAHGGKIWVKSTPGKVTTFYFTLPVQVVSKKQAA